MDDQRAAWNEQAAVAPQTERSLASDQYSSPQQFLANLSQYENKVTDGIRNFLAAVPLEISNLSQPAKTSSEASQAEARIKNEFPGDEKYQGLARKEYLAATNQGPELSASESADLNSKREFPSEPHYQNLAYRSVVGVERTPRPRGSTDRDLSPLRLDMAEIVDLKSKREFPNRRDDFFRELARRELTSNWGLSLADRNQKLSPLEQSELQKKRDELRKQTPSQEKVADILAQREFPNNGYFRNLAGREILARHGLGEPLSPKEQADLSANREFPGSPYFRGLASRESQFARGYGHPLSEKEKAALAAERQRVLTSKQQEKKSYTGKYYH